jgi:transposase-like protein
MASIRTGSHLLAVGWYLRSLLSYRDVEELLAEREISVDHVTLWRYRAVLCAGIGATPV